MTLGENHNQFQQSILFDGLRDYLAVTYAERLPMIRGGHEAWRYTLLSGLLPALPLLFIRPFLPESPLWLKSRSEFAEP